MVHETWSDTFVEYTVSPYERKYDDFYKKSKDLLSIRNLINLLITHRKILIYFWNGQEIRITKKDKKIEYIKNEFVDYFDLEENFIYAWEIEKETVVYFNIRDVKKIIVRYDNELNDLLCGINSLFFRNDVTKMR